MPPRVSILVGVECGSIDVPRVLDSFSKIDGVHAAITIEDLDGKPWILVMWRSLEEARAWIEKGELNRLLGQCRFSYRIFRVTGHVHGPAHHGHR